MDNMDDIIDLYQNDDIGVKQLIDLLLSIDCDIVEVIEYHFEKDYKRIYDHYFKITSYKDLKTVKVIV